MASVSFGSWIRLCQQFLENTRPTHFFLSLFPSSYYLSLSSSVLSKRAPPALHPLSLQRASLFRDFPTCCASFPRATKYFISRRNNEQVYKPRRVKRRMEKRREEVGRGWAGSRTPSPQHPDTRHYIFAVQEFMRIQSRGKTPA